MKKVICDVVNGYHSRIKEIRLVFNTDKLKGFGVQYTTLTLAVWYARPQRSLNGGKIGVYTFNYAQEFISFLKTLNLSEWFINEIWKGFEENDRIANELEAFLDEEEYFIGEEVEKLKEMFNA